MGIVHHAKVLGDDCVLRKASSSESFMLQFGLQCRIVFIPYNSLYLTPCRQVWKHHLWLYQPLDSSRSKMESSADGFATLSLIHQKGLNDIQNREGA